MTHKVIIKNMSFNPRVLKIKKGDEVYWSNEDSAMHTASRDDDPKFDTGEISGKTDSKTIQFNDASTDRGFSYICRPHAFMRGTIVVS
ncbi:plastocyanin/azurin family copper-binding protein [Flagellimonas sp. W118]|uniref:plastocyanin/azurin family copper-binding protein n=1 Tax=Flagellimonas sp. W118 TaxID=3410791 RepID=UPI003BF5FE7F